jgi:hypothetical protein
MNDMERKVEALTNALSKKCGGQGAAVVIGAGLNLTMTAAQQIPDKAMRKGLAMSFRRIADNLEQQNSGARQ